ncbi:MAG TPA: hypothetical protein VII06_01680, partial [Chloroflexota bacterium]
DGEHQPGGSGEAAAQSGEHQAVARAPGDALRPAPQAPPFVAQRETLAVTRCVTLAPEQGEVEE